MKKLQRVISMILAVTIVIELSGITGIKVMADEEQYVTMITNKQTINAGTKELSGLVAEKGDTTNLSMNLINFLDEKATVCEQSEVSGKTCTLTDDVYYKNALKVSCSKSEVANDIVAKNNIEFYVDKFVGNGETYLFSQNGNIIINASNVNLKGIIYAPNGKVTINVGEIDFTGVIIADEITINGGRVKIKDDRDISEYVEKLLMFANESYMELNGMPVEDKYNLDINSDKELEYIDIYVRYGNSKAFEKYTTINEKSVTMDMFDFETTIDIIAKGYTRFGEEICSTVESYGKDEYGDYYYFKNDTDDDGIADGVEIWYLNSNINSKDSDNDGFEDYYEVFVLGTDPAVYTADTDKDGDGLTDKEEMVLNINPYLSDSDFDGVNDGQDANPNSYDTGYEKKEYNYKVADTLFDINKIVKDEDGNIYVYVYNFMQKRDKAVIGEKKNTILYYDNLGKLSVKLMEIDGEYDINTYEYGEDKVAAISNNGYKYSISYNDKNIEKIYLNDTEIFRFEYDEEGNVVKDIYENGAVYEYEYDENGKISMVQTAAGEKYTYTYDENGNITKLLNETTGDVVIYSYKENEISDISFGDEFALNYNDDESNIRTTYTLAEESKELVCTLYDDNKIETMLISGDTFKDSKTEESLSVIIQRANGLELKRETVYKDKKTEKITYTDGSVETYYYKNDKLTKVMYNDLVVKEYTYDDFGRLIKETDNKENKEFTYTYRNDNIISKRVSVNGEVIEEKVYGYDNEWTDKLLNVSGKEIAYDGEGNIVKNGSKSYVWSGDLLTGYTDGEYEVTYKYNADGIRTSKTVNGVETKYYYDGEMLVAEKTDDDIIWYIYNMESEVIGFIIDDKVYYYEKNATGDIMRIIDENNETVVSYEYDAWGNILKVTGDESVAAVNSFTYKGYYNDKETGMYYLVTRYYDSEIGRFISIDGTNAILESYENYNLYAYCCNDPVNYADPDGLEKVNIVILCDIEDYFDFPYPTDCVYDEAVDYASLTKSTVQFKLFLKSEFIDYWNNVLSTNKKNIVVITGHGSPQSISFAGDALSVSDVNKLKVAKMDLLVLLQCNTAHDDMRKTTSNSNIAYAFYNKITDGTSNNKSMVIASDGTVVALSEGTHISINDSIWKDYVINSNRTKNYGWVIYRHGYSTYFINYSYKIRDFTEYDKERNIYIEYKDNDYITFIDMINRLTSVYSLRFIQIK